METLRTCAEVRSALAPGRRAGRRVALVPTMGDLHRGHFALVRRAEEVAALRIVSIFVNPFQFAEGEDFDTYPRTPKADLEHLEALGVDFVFHPSAAEIYPEGPGRSTRVEVPDLSAILCGAARPTFFRGVATVVNILFNVVQPQVAVFGEKDYQQLLVVRRMVEHLRLPVEIEGVATLREADGLAMSSRNRYLSPAERRRAPVLYRSLCEASERIRCGERDYPGIGRHGMKTLEEAGFRPDYFAVRRARDLGCPSPEEPDLVLLAAAWLGGARLIDNVRCVLPAGGQWYGRGDSNPQALADSGF